MAEPVTTPIGPRDPCPCGSGTPFQQCCDAASATAPQSLVQAQQAHRTGQLPQAIQAYTQVLQTHPGHRQALAGITDACEAIGATGLAAEHCRQLVQFAPAEAGVHARLSGLLMWEGHGDDALAHARAAVKLDDGNARIHRHLAWCLERTHKLDEALQSIQRSLQLQPLDPETKLIHCRVLRRLGQAKQALAVLDSLESQKLNATHLAATLSLRGHLLDDLGRYAEAFEAFEAAGQAQFETAAAQRLPSIDFKARITANLACETSQFLADWAATPFDDDLPAPVFFVGFPRSGTTMLEQILAAHSGIETLSERPMLQGLARELPMLSDGGEDIVSMLQNLNRAKVAARRQAYWQKVREVFDIEATGKILIDKLPLNILRVGLINLIFPEARIIVAIRDPRDVCLSGLMQLFALNATMINFVSLDRTTAFYETVMHYWLQMRERLTVQWIESRYEDLVADTETRSQQIFQWLELPWEPQVLEFHRSAEQRIVNTPSAAAVTEPVHNKAVARWRNYGSQLEPYVARLQPYLAAFGYDDE